MNSLQAFVISILLAAVLGPEAVRADVVSLSGAENARNIAEIRVDETGVSVALEVFPDDFEYFIDALPDDWFSDPDSSRPDMVERLQQFSSKAMQIFADDRRLPVVVRKVEPRQRVERYSPLAGGINPYSGRRIPGPPEDKRVLYLDLFYPFTEGNLPASLTIIPPLGDYEFAAVGIGFILFHNEVPVVDFSALTEASVLDLDWEDPWYSQFRQRSLKRWQESGMMTYLYIEPYEVRHEILVRVKDMLSLLDLGLRDDQWIEEDEFRSVEKAIGAFLLRHSNVVIDGQKKAGLLDRINFVQYTQRQTLFLTQPQRLLMSKAMLGVVVTYLTEGLPQEVAMEWDLFTDRVVKVPANAIDPAGPFLTYLTPDNPVHTWTNFLKTYTIPTVEAVAVDEDLLPPRIPLLSLALLLGIVPLVVRAWRTQGEGRSVRRPALIGVIIVLVAVGVWPLAGVRLSAVVPGPAMTPEQEQQLLEGLLTNVYRAFDLRDEEAVYDKLALTVAGDLLEDIYLQSRRSFVVEKAGGAQARVEKIVIEQVEAVRDGDGFRFDSEWIASGSVGHWGHTHLRTNRYRALITVQPRQGSWRITEMDILEETRIDPFGDPLE